MRKRLVFALAVILLLVVYVPRCVGAEAFCISPQSVERTTVRISRTEMVTVDGVSYPDQSHGTAWFVSPVHLMTVRHVAEALLRGHDTALVEMYQVNSLGGSGYHTEQMTVRLIEYLPRQASDELALLEMERFFPGMQIASVRMEPLEIGERVLSVGFPEGTYRNVQGKFMGMETFSGAGTVVRNAYRFKFYDDDNKVVMRRGASGSPVFDCSGRVAFVIDSMLIAANVTHCKGTDPWCTPRQEEFDMPDTPETATNLAVPVVDTVTNQQPEDLVPSTQ